MDTLDYTGPAVNEGSKGVWLGLGDPVRELPREFRPAVPPPPEVTDVRVFCRGCLVVGGPPFADDPGAAARLAAHPAFAGWPLVVLTDEPARAARSADELPVDDLHALRARGRHPRRAPRAWCATTSSYTPPILIDARLKPGFPAELFCRPRTARAASRARWREYFPGGGVEMGDSDSATSTASEASGGSRPS